MIIKRKITMKDKDGNWTPQAKEQVWGKAPLVDPLHPEYGKKDPCGACIKEGFYGNRDYSYGWEIDHIIPESILKDAGVPQELIDDIDNLRPMHWRNNVRKSNDFPIYGGEVTGIGKANLDVSRDYQVNQDQINALRKLYKDYIDINYPTVLGQWQAMIIVMLSQHRKKRLNLSTIYTPNPSTIWSKFRIIFIDLYLRKNSVFVYLYRITADTVEV